MATADRQLTRGAVFKRRSTSLSQLAASIQIAHHKALADIISMVKRAALETSPLLTAEERVNPRPSVTVAGDRTLSTEQASGWS